MAAFNFPSSPSNGDTYTLNSVTYQYDGTKWVRYSASVGAQGSTGSTGSQGGQGPQGPQGPPGPTGNISLYTQLPYGSLVGYCRRFQGVCSPSVSVKPAFCKENICTCEPEYFSLINMGYDVYGCIKVK